MARALSDFESSIIMEDKFQCAICVSWLRDPMQTICGHRFCKSCITTWIQRRSTCPVDNRVLLSTDIYPDNFTKREISQQQTKCPFAARGCLVVRAPLDMEEHWTECEFRNPKVQCHFQHAGCDEKFKNDVQLENHLRDNTQKHLMLLSEKIKEQDKTINILSTKLSKVDHVIGKPKQSLNLNKGVTWCFNNISTKIEKMREDSKVVNSSPNLDANWNNNRFQLRITISLKNISTLRVTVIINKADQSISPLMLTAKTYISVSITHPRENNEKMTKNVPSTSTYNSNSGTMSFEFSIEELSNKGFTENNRLYVQVDRQE